jgi:diguanylate cyclase (GGDEF)-like protein
MKIEDPRPNMVKTTSLFLLLTALIPSIVMPILVQQSYYFTLVGFANSVMFGVVSAIFYFTRAQVWHRYLLFFSGFVSLLPLIVFSGGVNSQFVVLLPIIPLVIALLSCSRDAWIASGLITLFIFCVLLLQSELPNLTDEVVSYEKSKSRAIWLTLSCLIGSGFAFVFNRTNRKLRLKLTEQAYQDVLTGISNRRNIIEVLESKIATAQAGQSLAILMIDVDHFKGLNDTYGHVFGDKCLQQVAKSISGSVRKGIDQVGRYGGEEFLVLLDNLDANKIHQIAEKIRINISELTLQSDQGEQVNLTVTVGWHCVKLNPSDEIETLLKAADEALYKGKSMGRNTVVCSL